MTNLHLTGPDVLSPSEAHIYAASERVKALQLRQEAERMARYTLALLNRAAEADRLANLWDGAARGEYET